MPNLQDPTLIAGVRRVTSVTERLCQLYVAVTMNMDLSLVKNYLQHGKVNERFKRLCTDNGDASQQPEKKR
jgi:hypothetical protein